jgi:hypothetical protein
MEVRIMGKRIVSFLTLTAFLAFAENCAIYNTKKITPEKVALKRGSGIKVLRVLKTNGEIIEFSEEDPAAIGYNCIVGKTGAAEKIEVEKTEVQDIIDKKLQFHITLRSGLVYVVPTYIDKESTIIFERPKFESIPLSEIHLIWLKERNNALTGLTVLGGIFFVIGAAYYAFIAIVFSGSSLF